MEDVLEKTWKYHQSNNEKSEKTEWVFDKKIRIEKLN